jgi:hypothetical protein
MQLKDVTPIIKAILEERDKIPRIINQERYIPNPQPYHDGNLIRGGIRKALRIIEQAPVVEATPRWTSVEERLPEYDRWVLCWYTDDDGRKWHTVGELNSRYKKWLLDIYNDDYDCEFTVTHWMPLPEPPKEE